MFSLSTYQKRRQALKGQMKSGIALFLGNNESPFNYRDNQYPFRQDSSFLYFFGLDLPALAVVIDFESGEETLFGDELTIDDIVWMGDLPTIKERALEVGITKTEPFTNLKKMVMDAKSKNRQIHFLPPYRDDHALFLVELLGTNSQELANLKSIELIKAVVALRQFKDENEVKELDLAATISTNMHLAAYRSVRPGMKEAEIAAKVTEISLREGNGLSFPVIATIHGEILHNHHHGNIMKEGDLFLLDCGAESHLHYAGDLSSTMPVGKTFSTRQKEIYQLSLDAHQAAVSALKPGVVFKDVHLKSAKVIAEGLKSLGILKGDMSEAVNLGVHAMFFPCGLGHMLGLDVHDMENLGEVYVGYDGVSKSTQFGLKSLRLGKELKEGFALTIEPGIYFIPALIDKRKAEGQFDPFVNWSELAKWRDFGGIRNEEDFLITADGARVIGSKKPLTISEVEDLRQEAY